MNGIALSVDRVAEVQLLRQLTEWLIGEPLNDGASSFRSSYSSHVWRSLLSLRIVYCIRRAFHIICIHRWLFRQLMPATLEKVAWSTFRKTQLISMMSSLTLPTENKQRTFSHVVCSEDHPNSFISQTNSTIG